MTTPSSSADLFKGLLPGAEQKTASTNPIVEPVVKPVVEETLEEVDPPAPTELDMLKKRAAVMGVSYSPNIGVDGLKAKIKAKLDGEAEEKATAIQASQVQAPVITANVDQSAPATYVAPLTAAQIKQRRRQAMRAEQLRLIRVRITNLNPSKKDLPGEIFTFANEVLGTVKKFIPYGEATENGYHIPFCIYTQLKEREFLNIRTRKDSRGRTVIEQSMAREFALEILNQLTPTELARLAASQAATRGTD